MNLDIQLKRSEPQCMLHVVPKLASWNALHQVLLFPSFLLIQDITDRYQTLMYGEVDFSCVSTICILENPMNLYGNNSVTRRVEDDHMYESNGWALGWNGSDLANM